MELLALIGVVLLGIWMRSIADKNMRLQFEVKQLRVALETLTSGGVVVPKDEAPENEDVVSEAGEIEPNDDEFIAAEPMVAQAASAEQIAEEPSEKPKRSWADMEQLVGAKWSVILGGIAIALGALFLVRYTIEAGLLGPAARIVLGFVVAAALLAGGEWLRRNDKAINRPVFARADIPGVLTAAGIVAAFGTLYAAHALYGFVGPAIAFVALTLIGLAALALSSIHGPKLAAIGLLGAFAAPLLVDSSAPNPFAITAHILVVTAASMMVARIRNWQWLTIGAIIGALIWATLLLASGSYASLYAAALIIVLSIMFVGIQCWENLPIAMPAKDQPFAIVPTISIIALALIYAAYAAGLPDFPRLFVAVVAGAIFMAAACYWPAMSLASIAAFITVLATTAVYALNFIDLAGVLDFDEFGSAIKPPDVMAYALGLLALGGIVGGIGAFGVHRNGATAPRSAGIIAGSVSAIAFFMVAIAYTRLSIFERHLATGAAAIALAFVFVFLVERTIRLRPDDMRAGAPAAYSVGAIALIALALGILLSPLWWPFGMALTALGIVWVYLQRPLASLPWIGIIAAGLSALSIFMSLPFAGVDIGTTPFLNQLVLLVGLPAVAVLVAGELLRKSGQGRTSAILTSIGLGLFSLFVALELRHWISGGEISSNRVSLMDVAVQSIAALGFSIGLQRVARYTRASVFSVASLVVGMVSIVIILLGLMLAHNPLITNNNVDSTLIFNDLLPAYFITGVLAALIAYMARPVRPRWYTLSYAFLASILLFTYFTLHTRQIYQGGQLGFWRSTSDLEFWTYSAVWLVLGGVLLAVGLYFKSLPLRAASAVLIGLTILKVFLLDMTALTGALRAFSFMGLGLSLIVIGRFYQRILLGSGNSPDLKDEEPEGQEA